MDLRIKYIGDLGELQLSNQKFFNFLILNVDPASIQLISAKFLDDRLKARRYLVLTYSQTDTTTIFLRYMQFNSL